MPYSSALGKDWIKEKVRQTGGIATVLDVGAGSGTYAALLRDVVLPDAHFTAIEIWEPYVEQFNLLKLYDKVIVGNVLEVLPIEEPYDLAIFGDVLEHMTAADAIWAVERFAWEHAIISIPVMPYPQGEYAGNTFEEHISTWTARDVRNVWGDLIKDEIVLSYNETAEAIGVFWMEQK